MKGQTFWEYIVDGIEEDIKCVSIGQSGGDGFRSNATVPKDKMGKLMTPEQASKYLSYEYVSSYGAPKCHSVYVWTDTRIYFIVDYDGSTHLDSVPRNPEEGSPSMIGG